MSDNPQNNPVVDVLTSTKSKIKRVARRIGFHFVAFIIGGFSGERALQNPLTIMNAFPLKTPDDFKGDIIALVYFSMLLLFPFQPNRAASALGIFTAIACIFTGYGSLGIVFGGLTAFIIYTINRRKISIGSIIPLLFIFIGIAVNPLVITSAPLWYDILLGSIITSGIIYHDAITLLIERVTKKRSPSVPVKQTVVENTPPPVAPPNPYSFDMQTYLTTLQEIQRLKKALPVDFIPLIDTISLKTQSILQSMKSDERDVARGTQFLNRYLPIIRTSLDRFIRLSAQSSSSPEFAKIRQQTWQAFSDMSHVFSDMNQRLLDNDVNDLIVDLNVLDKLAKSEGYTIPKE
ncbi:hypothetical protein C9426_09615 [Serratia sp. S1B]|nr:hypothetical protein C9426_09615 [Serratia sp. S1B]